MRQRNSATPVLLDGGLQHRKATAGRAFRLAIIVLRCALPIFAQAPTLHSATLTVTDAVNPGAGMVQYFIYQQPQACSATTQWVAGNRIAGPVTLMAGSAANTFVFTTPVNLGPGDWCFAVSAIFPANNAGEGPLSPSMGATITGPTPPPPPPPVPVGKPVAPQALAVQVN